MRFHFAADVFTDVEADFFGFVIFNLQSAFDRYLIVLVVAAVLDIWVAGYFAFLVAGANVGGDGDFQIGGRGLGGVGQRVFRDGLGAGDYQGRGAGLILDFPFVDVLVVYWGGEDERAPLRKRFCENYAIVLALPAVDYLFYLQACGG